MALRMTITEDRDVVIVALSARIDSFAIEELYEGFEQVKKTGKRNIVLMMRELEYINSRGIATLISFFKWAKEEGRSVKLAQVPKNIMQLLSLLGIEKLTSIYDTLPEAIESFEQDLAEELPEEAATLNEEGPRGEDLHGGRRAERPWCWQAQPSWSWPLWCCSSCGRGRRRALRWIFSRF